MSQYIPSNSASVVIGVCGEQASGKTVFLTCIFQSIWTAFPDDVIVDFERKEVGNATYFQSIEDSLIAKGPTTGTTDRSLFPARIYIKPYAPLSGNHHSVLSVDLLDFAGRHFRSMADLKGLLEASESDPEDVKALREVNDTLERADAFVILINSTEIDPLDETPRRNPFSPSVNFMLAHCRAERKPVALLFSQIDQTPRLTEELFRTLPRVQEFERKFTQDQKEATSGGRPFGIVRRISCYETVPGDLAPRRQTLDGSIWRSEPAQVVLELLRAAMPRINERLAREAREAKEARLEQERETQRRRKRQWIVRAAAALGAVAILGGAAFAWYKRTEGHQVRLLEGVEVKLREGKLASIPAASEVRLGEILAAHRAAPGRTPSGVGAAIAEVESALGAAARRLTGEPLLEAAYGEEIVRLESLVPHFAAAATEPWRPGLLPRLSARREFLSDWFGNARKERRVRTGFLDASVRSFLGSGDWAFAKLLAAQSTREKETEVAAWRARIDADADVTSRLATMQYLLAAAAAERDPELLRLARLELAAQLVVTILKRHENGLLREKLLVPLAPDLSALGDGDVRFEVLARVLLTCADLEACDGRKHTVRSALTEANTIAASWTSGVENLLRSLLLDLPVEQRPEVWGALADALGGAYLFSQREDAWPAALRPLAIDIPRSSSAESGATETWIARIARRPLYEGELLYLGDRLTALSARRQVVPIYSNLLAAVAAQESLLIGYLTAIDNDVSSTVADRTDAAPPLVEIQREIEQVLVLARSINEQRSRRGFGDPSAATRLQRLLREALRGHCAALAPQDAPGECADAA